MSAALDPAEAVTAFREAGFGPFTGVPCSFLGPVISVLQHEYPDQYVIAGNEGEAVAVAVGAWLAGRRPVVILQNSGLGNAVNPLTSLCATLRVPTLLLVTWRGEPGTPDEPQHETMGLITRDLLTAMGIRHEILPNSVNLLRERLKAADAHMDETGMSFAFVVPKGAVARYADATSAKPPGRRGPMVRSEAIGLVMRAVGEDALVVATTGKTARELERDWDRPGNLYVVGSMGCASSVALGIAHSAPHRRVVVLDGDGAALMRLEAMAGIGRLKPPNLLHVLLDNESYESTGGQPTGSAGIDFAEVATACGYLGAVDVHDARALTDALARELPSPGPSFIRVRIAAWSDPELGRPALPPPVSAARFRSTVTT